MRRAVLTLGDLLEEKALGLALRTGGAEAAERPVPGAAVVEVESPSIAVSSVVIVALMIASGPYSNDPIIYGLLSSLVVFVGVSLVTAPAGNRATGRAQVTA